MPITSEEFDVVVDAEDMDFVRGLSATDRWGLFANVSHTLFRIGSLISFVFAGQDVVLGSGELLKERDELKDRCEVLEQRKSDVEKELVVFRENADADDRYGQSLVLDASLAKGKKHNEKVFAVVVEVYRAFEADQKTL